MKYTFLLCIVILLSACKNDQATSKSDANETSQNSTEAKQDSEVKPISVTTDNPTLERQNACEVMTMDEIAALLHTVADQLAQDNMDMGKDNSICYYYSKDGNKKLFMRMAWANERAQEYEVLTRQYSSLLQNGDKTISTYTHIATTANSQIIYGKNEDRVGNMIHIARKRFGNTAEVQVELTTSDKDTDYKDRLVDIVRAL